MGYTDDLTGKIAQAYEMKYSRAARRRARGEPPQAHTVWDDDITRYTRELEEHENRMWGVE